MKLFLVLVFLLSSLNTMASVDSALSYYLKASRDPSYYPKVIKELVDDGYYYTSIPLIKEYLVSAKKIDSRKIDDLLEEVIRAVGVRQFEVLSKRVLNQTKSPIIQYIYAKKLYRERKYKQS